MENEKDDVGVSWRKSFRLVSDIKQVFSTCELKNISHGASLFDLCLPSSKCFPLANKRISLILAQVFSTCV